MTQVLWPFHGEQTLAWVPTGGHLWQNICPQADMSVPMSYMDKQKAHTENLTASRLRFKMWPFGVLGLWLSNSWGTNLGPN